MSGKGRRAGSAILRLVITALIFVAIVAAVAFGSKFIHAHNEILTQGEGVDLNEIVESGKALPMDQYVDLRCWLPLGNYATETNKLSSYGAEFDGGMDYYYAVMVNDGSILSAKVSSRSDIDALDGLIANINTYNSLQEFLTSGNVPSHVVKGKLVELKNDKILGYYKSFLLSMGYASNDPAVRYVAVDATSIRIENAARYIGIPVGILLVLFIFLHIRKRRQLESDWYQNADRANTDGGL